MAIKTRETAGTGVTNKGAPLTNAEVDTNFIELVAEDATKLEKAGGTMTGSLTLSGANTRINLPEDHVINRRFEMNNADNNGVAYVLLCRNTSNNDVNGRITMDRTSGLRHACQVDIIVSSGTSGNPIGSLKAHGVTVNAGSSPNGPSYELVTVTYDSDSNSYVALKITNPDSYYETNGAFFTGRLVNSGSNTLVVTPASGISSEAQLADANAKHTFQGDLDLLDNIVIAGTVDGRDVAADGTKLDGIEASADVTDATNVTAAGALMDSEVTNLAQVKAFDSSDYATAAQGTTADAALPKAGGTMTGDLVLGDDVNLTFGAASDLQIRHEASGSHSVIRENGSGSLYVDATNLFLRSRDFENMAKLYANGAVELYYNNAIKCATTNTGINVTGNIAVSGTVDGRDVATDGTRLDDNIIYNATNTNNVAGVWEATISDVTSYTDGLMIAFYPNKIDGISGGTTFEINSLGAKTVTRPDSSTNAITTHYDGTNLIFLRYVSADDYFIVHANYNTTDDYRIRWQNYVIANNIAGTGTAWHGYQLVIEGVDGKFYPVTEGGSTGNTNTVSTVELRVGGTILLYESSTNRAAGEETNNVYESLRTTTMEYWNNRDSGWATDNKAVYLVATKNSNGNFVLDNTSFTSFLTQDLPTSDDGKYYIKIGWMNDNYDDFRLEVNHPIYIYKNGAIREWGGYASNADQLDGIEASSFLRSDATDSATGALTFGNSITLSGSQTGGYPQLSLTPGSASTAYIYMGASADPDEGAIQYSPSSNTMAFVAGATTALRLTNTTIEATKDITLPDNEYLKFGASNDLTIGHVSTYSANTIDATGTLALSSSNNILFKKDSLFGEQLANFTVDGACELFYDNSKKIETTSSGIQTSGTLNINGAYSFPTTDGTNGQVLTTDGSGAVTFQDASGGGGSSLTIKDEGTALSTAATTLNFTGSGVTATGSGAEKTINIPTYAKYTDFDLTPNATSVTLSLGGDDDIYKVEFRIGNIDYSGGPNNATMTVKTSSNTNHQWDIQGMKMSNYTDTGSGLHIDATTDLLSYLNFYSGAPENVVYTFYKMDGDLWTCEAVLGTGTGNTGVSYLLHCRTDAGSSFSNIGSLVFTTGSSSNVTAFQGTIVEYYK